MKKAYATFAMIGKSLNFSKTAEEQLIEIGQNLPKMPMVKIVLSGFPGGEKFLWPFQIKRTWL